MSEIAVEPPVTVDVTGFLAGIKLDAMKREATISIRCNMTPEFMAVLDRLGHMGRMDQMVSASITPQQTGLGF